MIVYISIGNSDDKLSQRNWTHFLAEVDTALNQVQTRRHGAWHSSPFSPWQNACWCVEIPDDQEVVAALKVDLAEFAREYSQDSITWAEAPRTEFLCPPGQP